MEHTSTRTAIEKFTDEEGIKLFGVLGWLDCLLKAQRRHDSSRNERKRLKDQKAESKKERFRPEED